MQPHAEAMEVEERQRVHEHVVLRPAPDLDRAATLGEEGAVVDDRALGPASGPRRVEDRGGAVRRQVGHGRRVGLRQVLERDDPALQPGHDPRPRPIGDDRDRVGVGQDVLGLG